MAKKGRKGIIQRNKKASSDLAGTSIEKAFNMDKKGFLNKII
jgi:hypothetical protein